MDRFSKGNKIGYVKIFAVWSHPQHKPLSPLQINRLQSDLSQQYLLYREERDARKLLIWQLNDLTGGLTKKKHPANQNTSRAATISYLNRQLVDLLNACQKLFYTSTSSHSKIDEAKNVVDMGARTCTVATEILKKSLFYSEIRFHFRRRVDGPR